MINQDIRDQICDMGYDDSIILDDPSFDNAIIGVSIDGNIIYDYDKMVESLMQEDGIEEMDSIDFIDYNTIRAIPYMPNPRPIIVYRLIE